MVAAPWLPPPILALRGQRRSLLPCDYAPGSPSTITILSLPCFSRIGRIA